MRHITNWQKFLIYFNTTPFIIGEGFSICGMVIPFVTYPNPIGFLGLILTGGGIFLVKRKVDNMKFGVYVLTHGLKTEAEITRIDETNWSHNSRTVKEYNFQYMANAKLLNHQSQSAYKRHFQIGTKIPLFYVEDDPTLCFIPKLYNLNIE